MLLRPKAEIRYLIAAGFLLFGGLSGCMTVNRCSAAARESIVTYLQTAQSPPSMLAEACLPALCIALTAFSAAGFLLIPLMDLLLGFAVGAGCTALLSGPIAANVIPLLCSVFLLQLPCVIALSAAALHVSRGLLLVWRSRGARSFDGRQELRTIAALLAVILLTALIQTLLTAAA